MTEDRSVKKYRLLADFKGQGKGELSLKYNDLVVALDDTPQNGWLNVRMLREPYLSGYVPVSYLKDARQEIERSNNADISTEKKPGTATQHIRVNPFDLDQYRAAQPHKFQQTLEYWRERERRLKEGEEEKLPEPKKRIYFYWDRDGVRQGPLTESQMRAKFDKRQFAVDTPISLATEENSSLEQKPIEEYFPNVEDAFQTVPVITGSGLWWCYLDDTQNVQGPYSAEQMYHWFQEGYFNADTPIRISTESDFVPLGKLFPDGAGAFLSLGQTHERLAVPALKPRDKLMEQISVSNLKSAFPPEANGAHDVDESIKSGDIFESVNHLNVNPAAPLEDVTTSSGGWRVDEDESINALIDRGRAFSHQDARDHTLRREAYSEFDPYPHETVKPGLDHEDGKNIFVRAMSADEKKEPWHLSADGDSWIQDMGFVESNTGEDFDLPIALEREDESKLNKKRKELPVTRKLASFDELNSHIESIDKMYLFLTRAIPKGLGVIQCRIIRGIPGIAGYSSYSFYLEKDGKSLGPELLRATKHSQMLISSYYDISLGSASKHEKGKIIAELRHNISGTHFLLHNNVRAHRGVPRDLCVATYQSNSEKEKGPRVMQAAIPSFQPGSESEFHVWKHRGSTDHSKMLHALMSLDLRYLQVFRNKPPVWSEKHRAFTLNFHGRVTRSSVKNFQLVQPYDETKVIVQHGKIGANTFTMDICWPMSPLAGFAICLSSLHHKYAVE